MPQPYVQFYFRDHCADEGLAQCSMAAQGFWVRMMGTMQSAARYGYFEGPRGAPIDLAKFARGCGQSPANAERWVAELDAHDVFSRDEGGTIYSRRLVRDHDRRRRNRRNGQAGGNPALFGLTDSDNQPDNPAEINGLTDSDNRLGYAPIGKPISRNQIPDTDSLRSSALSVPEWPDDLEALRLLAVPFVAAFANCRDPDRAKRHIAAHTAVLAQMRNRGVSIAVAWAAFADAHAVSGPLWGDLARRAMSFLPPSPRTGERKRYDRGVSGGSDYAAALEGRTDAEH